jgi:hypothetical protein
LLLRKICQGDNFLGGWLSYISWIYCCQYDIVGRHGVSWACSLKVLSFDLKINSGPSILITNPHIKYHCNQMKCSHDVEGTSCGLQTDRCHAICPSYFNCLYDFSHNSEWHTQWGHICFTNFSGFFFFFFV